MVHDREIPFLKYNDENALSCVVTLCYLYARKDYRIEREEKSGKGFCDYLFYPKVFRQIRNRKPTNPVNTAFSALHRFQSYIISMCF